MSDAADVLKKIKDEDVSYIDFRFTDSRGKWQHIAQAASTVDEGMLEEGMGIRQSVYRVAVLLLLVQTVAYGNSPPHWCENPVDMGEQVVGEDFVFYLSPYACDPDGDVLTFTKVFGPVWLSVGRSGMVLGTPPAGAFTAVFRVSDGQFSSVVAAEGVGVISLTD